MNEGVSDPSETSMCAGGNVRLRSLIVRQDHKGKSQKEKGQLSQTKKMPSPLSIGAMRSSFSLATPEEGHAPCEYNTLKLGKKQGNQNSSD